MITTKNQTYFLKIALMKYNTCMFDHLGHVEYLNEAKRLYNNMPIKYNVEHVWTCFLTSCSIHNNIELAKFVA